MKRKFTNENKPLPIRIGQVLKRGYELELLQPSPTAQASAQATGRLIKPLPAFRKT